MDGLKEVLGREGDGMGKKGKDLEQSCMLDPIPFLSLDMPATFLA